MQVDHINGNVLDNRRVNLRICNNSNNSKNKKMFSTNKSGFKGVHFHAASKLWASQIQVNTRKIWLGSFETPELAYKAYCEAAVKYHGEFARFQ